MEFMELLRKRYSVRKFSDRPLEPEKLRQLLDAGNLAPTARNIQPQRVYVLQSEGALAKINALSPCVFGAKTVLVFAYDANEEWKNPLEEGVHSGVEDVSIAATQVMLCATTLGLGTCWCNYFPNSKLEEAFGFPEQERAVLFMPIGYPAEDAEPSPMHEKRKALEETVRYL